MIEGTTCAMVCVWRSEENIVESVLFFQLYIGSWVESQFARLAQQTSLSTETSPHSLSQTSFISLQFPLIFFNSYFHSQNSWVFLMWRLEKILKWRAAWVPGMMLLFRDLEMDRDLDMEMHFHAWLLVQMQSWSHRMLLWASPRSDQEGSLLVELC